MITKIYLFYMTKFFIFRSFLVKLMPKKKSFAKRVLNLEEEEEEEEQENDAALVPELDHELFRELIEELDKSIERSMNDTYRETLAIFNRILAKSRKSCAAAADCRVPTLFLSGHCLDWNWLFKRLRKSNKNLVIENEFAQLSEELTTDSENESDEHLKEREVILFFQDNSFSKSEVWERILSLVGRNSFVLLLVHNSLSFSSINERIPRLFVIQMHIVDAFHLPSADQFLRILFAKYHCFLPQAGVQFHDQTLKFVRQMFMRDHQTLVSVRNALVFALLEYATEYGGEKRPNSKERKEFSIAVEKYFTSLGAFVSLLNDQNEFGNVGEFSLQLHCQIQNQSAEKFGEFYARQKQKWENCTIENWRNKIKKIKKLITDEKHKKECDELIAKLDQQRNRSRNDQLENVEPLKKSPLSRSSIRRSTKTKKIFIDQQQLLSRLINPLDTQLRAELFQFLDSLFLPFLRPSPNKFVAGPGDLKLLDPSLSVELDCSLSNMSDETTKLDIAITYQLLSLNPETYDYQLSLLREAFCSLANAIAGLDKEARFLAAIAQLEHIGMVKLLPNDFVRLIYLPGAAFIDFFENNK